MEESGEKPTEEILIIAKGLKQFGWKITNGNKVYKT